MPGIYRFDKDELNELASIWSKLDDALSLYFKPGTPSELTHRDEPVRVKEMIQQQLRSLNGNGDTDRGDIKHLLQVISEMQGNHGLTKVIFACKSLGVWHEYELAGDFGVRLDVGHALAVAPLVAEQENRKRYAILLPDRSRARLLLLEARQLIERREALEEGDREKIRTTGARKSVHLERQKEEQAREHFTVVAERLLHFYEHGDFDALLVGCRDETWPEIETHLHENLKRALAGRFHIDPGVATREEIIALAQPIIDRRDRETEEELVEKVIGGALSQRLGVTGLDAVMNALEKGEVRTLVWADRREPSPEGASSCLNCGHIEHGNVPKCELCGAELHWFARDEEALVRHALGRNLEVRFLHYTKLPPPDQIGAWLRFQTQRNPAQALAS